MIMKKRFFISMSMLVCFVLPLMVACSSDDDDEMSYTSDEIVEILNGKWSINGEFRFILKDGDKIVTKEGNYTGTIEFKKDQKYAVQSTPLYEYESTINGKNRTSIIKLDDLLYGSTYSLLKKGGEYYISLGIMKEPYDMTFKIVSLTKKSFNLVLDRYIENTKETLFLTIVSN